MSQKADSSSQYFAYFGYGSLVNRKTLSSDIAAAIPVTLKGWRRHWQSRPKVDADTHLHKKIALLSVHPDNSDEIEGLLIVDRIENLEHLDQREQHYCKNGLMQEDFNIPDAHAHQFAEIPIHLYVARPGQRPDSEISLLQSYLDVVMAGYIREFGKSGLQRFFDSTSNFDVTVIEDRSSPVYPRHLPITPKDAMLFDNLLRKHTGAII